MCGNPTEMATKNSDTSPRITSVTPCALSYTSAPYPYAPLTPYLRRVFDAYGPKRMMWGSDISKLDCTYQQALDHFQNELDFLKGADRDWVLGQACAALLHWRL